MARLQLNLRFRVYHLLAAVLVAALVVSLVMRRRQFQFDAFFNQGLAAYLGALPTRSPAQKTLLSELSIAAAEATRQAVRFDWLILALLIVPASFWLLGSLGVFHRARLRSLARDYQYAPPPRPCRESAASRFLSDNRGVSPYQRAGL